MSKFSKWLTYMKRFSNPGGTVNNCRPNICNTGRCVSLKTTYYCQCPDDRYGEHCEKRFKDIIRFNLRSTDETAISHYATAGPVFGLDDIYICHRPNENNLSYSNFPHCYEDLEKNGKGRKTFSKSKCFLVNEIEVYMTIM
ncbi:unnamed protein product [Rotaria sp. Silwood1]|nr:unnamed protein product [Rotaria sp. Silwood1]